MENYMNSANGGLVYLLAAVVIVVVMAQSIVFLRIALKRGHEIGLSRDLMKQTIKSSAVFSVIPSLPIVIALIAIAPVLGLPFSWLRLSVIGSNSYELIAADTGAKAMGLEGITSEGYNIVAFSNSMWVMTLGIIWGLLACIFILKNYQLKMQKIQKKDSLWAEIMVNALFFGMLSVFLGRPIAAGGLPLYVLLSSAAIMVVLNLISKRFKLSWISDFALSFSMIGGMALAILYTNIGGF